MSPILASSSGVFLLFVVYIAVLVLVIAGWWKIFVKAGHPGWGAIIPIYNVYLMCKTAGRPGWWVILYIIPFVNIVVSAMVAIEIARAFAKSTGFGVGLWLLSFVFAPMLGFGDDVYSPPASV